MSLNSPCAHEILTLHEEQWNLYKWSFKEEEHALIMMAHKGHANLNKVGANLKKVGANLNKVGANLKSVQT